MSLTPPKPDNIERQLPPAGTHRAVLYKIINLGTLDTEWQGQAKKSHKIRLIWELSDEEVIYTTKDERGQEIEKTAPFAVGRKFTLSMGDNSHLFPFVQGMIGVALTDDERYNFDIESLLGRECLITVVHAEYEGRKFAQVTNASTLPKGMEKPKQINETVMLDVRKLSQQEIGELPEYIRVDMEASSEYDVRFNAPRTDAPQAQVPPQVQAEQELNPEDIPFN